MHAEFAKNIVRYSGFRFWFMYFSNSINICFLSVGNTSGGITIWAMSMYPLKVFLKYTYLLSFCWKYIGGSTIWAMSMYPLKVFLKYQIKVFF